MAQKYKVFINNKLNIIVDNWQEFCDDYKIIYASGGLVYNNTKLLMIFRNGKWDLPKGKKEKNETDEQCAIREVIEECGIDNLVLKKYIKKTYHTYMEKGKKILKITSWFLMYSDYDGDLTPQRSEGIQDVCWVKKSQISKNLKNSYENIIDLVVNL